MSTEDNNQGVAVEPQSTDGEGNESNTIALSRDEYDKLNETIGSLKRDLKQAQKAKSDTTETPKQTNSDELSSLKERLDNQTLLAAQIDHEDDIALAKDTAKKWNMELDRVVRDEDFLAKLERQKTSRANADATSNVKGDKSNSSSKNSVEYWVAKGVPPTREQVPDRKERAKIARAMMASEKSTSKFYND